MKIHIKSLAILAFITPTIANAEAYLGADKDAGIEDNTPSIYVSPHAGTGYVGASIGSAMYDVNISDDNDLGFKGFLGYRLNDYFAYELAYVDFGSISQTTDTYYASVDVNTVALSLIGMYPITSSFDFFAKVGANRWHKEQDATIASYSASDTEDGTDIMYGAGLEYGIDKFTIRTEFERYRVDGIDIDLVSLGFQLHF